MRFLAIPFLLFPVAIAHADDKVPGPVPATFVENYDGDTFTVRCTVWPGHVVTTRVRPRSVDTPEIRGDCPREKRLAREARDFTARVLRDADTIRLHDIEHGKYAGRVVARVTVDRKPLSRLLIEAGLGKPYDGGTRPEWCDPG